MFTKINVATLHLDNLVLLDTSIPCQLPSPTLWTCRKHYWPSSFPKVLKKNLSGLPPSQLFVYIHILLTKGRYLVWRPWAKILPVFFFLNSTLTTAIAFPTRRTLLSISISSYNYISHRELNKKKELFLWYLHHTNLIQKTRKRISHSSNYQFDITHNNNTACKNLKGVVLLIYFLIVNQL